MKKSIIKKILLVIGLVLLLAAGAAFYWLNDVYEPMEEALGIWEASSGDTNRAADLDGVEAVIKDQWIHFQPGINLSPDQETSIGFIYYPGGRVDYRSYSPLLWELAQEGMDGFLVEMPLNLAVLGRNRGAEIIENHPEIDTWIIGGHSLGGAMAANFVYNHPQAVKGLVFFAAYPAGSNDLSDFENLSVLSIYGNRDGFVSEEDIDNSREYVPGNTQWLEIEGGNHSQFGWYGFQKGDSEAEISREEQQRQILDGILQWLKAMENLR